MTEKFEELNLYLNEPKPKLHLLPTEKKPTFDDITETTGLCVAKSTFYNGGIKQIAISAFSETVNFTADTVKILATKCEEENNEVSKAGAAMEFISTNGQRAIIIMTETELRATLAGSKIQRSPLNATIAFAKDFNPLKNSFVKPAIGIVREDFRPVFEDALQQVIDAKALVKLGRHGDNKGATLETSRTNAMQAVNGTIVTAYASSGFPLGELGTDGNRDTRGTQQKAKLIGSFRKRRRALNGPN